MLLWDVVDGLVKFGEVKGGHGIKVREALDLVTFLTGLLNSRLRVII
jgi:hypothetical protein